MKAGVDRTTVQFLIRDFVTAGLKEKEACCESLARETVAAAGPAPRSTSRSRSRIAT